MGKFIAENTVKLMARRGSAINGAKVNVLGLTFKENCPDLRNSKVPDISRELESYGIEVFVHDPVADADEAMHEYGIGLTEWDNLPEASAVVVAVAHENYRTILLTEELSRRISTGGVVIDVKSFLNPAMVASTGFTLWRL